MDLYIEHAEYLVSNDGCCYDGNCSECFVPDWFEHAEDECTQELALDAAYEYLDMYGNHGKMESIWKEVNDDRS